MLKLVQTDWGAFDLAVDEALDADVDAVDATDALIETIVYAVLFTDQEAPAARVPDRFDRRGWYNDPQAGSGLWHVRRQALTAAARRESVTLVERALKAQAPALTDISVVEEFVSGAAGASNVSLKITGRHRGRDFLIRAPL
jgi:phage gp46-like protein